MAVLNKSLPARTSHEEHDIQVDEDGVQNIHKFNKPAFVFVGNIKEGLGCSDKRDWRDTYFGTPYYLFVFSYLRLLSLLSFERSLFTHISLFL